MAWRDVVHGEACKPWAACAMTKLRQKSLPPTGSIAAKLDNAQANVDCGNMPCIQFVLVSRKKLPHGPSSSRPCASSSPAGLACLWCGCVIGFFVQVSCEQRAANSGCRNRRQSIGAACSAQARKRPGRGQEESLGRLAAHRSASETCLSLSRTIARLNTFTASPAPC